MESSTFLIHPGSHHLPEIFWQIEDPPAEIHVKSARSLEETLHLLRQLPERGLAVVGTRRPQSRSLRFLREQIQALAGTDLIILSGLALGIDAQAHEAAIQAGLKTIAVLGGNLSKIYPPENTPLHDRILESGGLIIAEHPEDEPLRPHFFLKRNRLIAGWSKATWIVEASHRSGALNTARWARDQNRDCFATPCFPGDSAMAGNQNLIDEHHARPLWGAHGLGATWLEYSTWMRSSKKPRLPGENELLLRVISRVIIETGGCSLSDLMEWALCQNWESDRLFEELDRLIHTGKITEEKGMIITNCLQRSK